MLDVVNLHTYYGDSHVLQGVTLRAERGVVTGVLGRNGMGKTTLCRSLTGLTPARSGQIRLDDVDITHRAPHDIRALGMSLVPQGRRIFSSLTVQENLTIAATGHANGAGWDLDKVFSVFPRLAERRLHWGNELSGGEQQMLAIGRALVANAKLLIMDEPTEGLSPALVADVGALIRRVKQEGTSVLLVEQNAAFAVQVSDFVHVMSKGTIVYSSEPLALWEDHDVRTQWLGVRG